MLPNLLIIGAGKAGTTSLHAYLAQHPSISMSEPKELAYFWKPDWREQQGWYERHFDASKPVRGESTPSYSMWSHREHVPERAAELIPDAKLVYLVRDPIERLVSHWRQRLSDGFDAPFSHYMERLEELDNPVVCASRYATQLERWLRFFDLSRTMIIDHREFAMQRDAVVRRALEFLEVDADVPLDLDFELNTAGDKYAKRRWAAATWDRVLWPLSRVVPEPLKRPVRGPANRAVFRKVSEYPEIDDALRARLVAYFSPEVERLRELTGLSFPSWSL